MMAVFSAIASAIGAIGSAVSGLTGGGVLSGLGAVAGIAGTAIQTVGAMRQAKGAERAEALRQRQMNLESTRARRQTVRQAVIARSQAVSNATAQGADGGSGLAGGLGQISGQANSNLQGINQGQSIGTAMFDANRMISSGQTMQSVGSGVSGFGNAIAQNYEALKRIF